jgi:multidrug efflux pump subunit AcrA (membrane-fusion protein)
MGDLDPMGRMARVLVEIEDPLGLATKVDTAVGERAASAEDGLPLLIGAFVKVEIAGREVADAVEIPREALRGGDTVYVMAGKRVDLPDQLDGLLGWAEPGDVDEMLTHYILETREVSVVWRLPESIIIDKGLGEGDLVITSPVPSPIEGMTLRTLDPVPSGSARPDPDDKQAAVTQ